MRYLIVAALPALFLSACGADHAAKVPTGEWKPLNVGQWDIDPALVTVPDLPKIKDPDKA